jgi:hypothetical protein
MTVPANSAPATQGNAGRHAAVSFSVDELPLVDMGEGGGLTRLVLVFALELEDVEEVGGGGVNLNEVVVVLGDGIRQV